MKNSGRSFDLWALVVRILILTCLIQVGLVGSCCGEDAFSFCEEREEKILITDELRPDGEKAVRAVFRVKADPDLVYQTLRDVERFPEFMPNSERVEILEQRDGFQIVKFSGSRGVFKADIVMERLLDNARRRIDWHLVEGPPRALSGYWQVERENEKKGALITYYNYLDAGRLIPDFLVRIFLRDDIRAMAATIRKRVEGGGICQSEE